MWKFFYSILVFVSVVFAAPLCQAQAIASKAHNKIKIQLVAKYKLNELYDISPDRKLFLFRGPSTPISEPNSGIRREWVPKKAERYMRVLRVVEWETGREFAKVDVEYLGFANFVDDNTNQVCFKERETTLWNYASGQKAKCELTPKSTHYVYRGYFDKYDSPKSKYRVEASVKKATNFLFLAHVRGIITVFDRVTGEKLAVATHPTEKMWAENKSAGSFYGFAITSDENYLITYYASDTYIWQLSKQ